MRGRCGRRPRGRFRRVSGRVAWISHCPVKGLALRQLDECQLTEAGVAGDRQFFLVDENDRLVNSKGLGILQQIVPRYDDQAELLTLAFPDGTTLSHHVHLNGALDAQFWGTSVHVRVVLTPTALPDLRPPLCGIPAIHMRSVGRAE